MKTTIILTILAAVLTCPGAHGKPAMKQLVYRFPDKDGAGKVWACPDRPPEVDKIGAEIPWKGCEPNRPEFHFFEAGDIVQLWVYNFPLLSQFNIEVKGEQVYTANLPFIRGVSDVAPAKEEKEKADVVKSWEDGTPAPENTLDQGQQEKLKAVTRGMGLGSDADLKNAADLLRDLQEKARVETKQAISMLPKIRILIDMLTGVRQTGYPGPSLEAIHEYSIEMAEQWRDLKPGDAGCVEQSKFSNRADDTKLLIDAVADYNARTKTLPAKNDFAKINLHLNSLYNQFDLIAETGFSLLGAADKSNTLKRKINFSAERVQPAPPVPSDEPKTLEEFREKYNLGKGAVVAPATAEADLREIRDITVEAATYRGYLAKWDRAMQVLLDTPADINEKMREIFATANSKYVVHRACGVQVMNVKQWTGMAGANVVATEVPGFKLFSMAAAVVNDAPETPKASPVKPRPSSKVDLPKEPGEDEGSGSETSGSDAPDVAKEKPSQGTGGKAAETPKPACLPICCCEPAKKEKDSSGASSRPNGSVVSIPVQVHQFARANLVAGFARSWLKNREYGFGQVGRRDAAGNPLLDSNGGQLSIRSGVETKNQPGQYVYYVGLNFYLARRDLHPQARNNNYWIPGLMFAYGVNEELNFLTGLNWETRWGVNLGGGAHFGRVTGLGNFGGIPGESAIPDTVMTVPTVQRFGLAPYLSIGFDGSVFGKVWGAVKGVKPPK